MEIKTALVTGGSGYLGGVLSKHLQKKGWNVICFDLKTPTHKYHNLFINGDIRDREIVDDTFRGNKIDAVFHLAGRIEVADSMKNPTEFWEVNTAGTCILLNAMNRYGVKYIIYSSTAGVYWPSNSPLTETECVIDNHVYGNTKFAAENAIRDSGIKHVIFRYFNLAGAEDDVGENHEPETHLIPSILKNLNNFSIYGTDYSTEDGSCVRDYVHVSDVAKAHISAVEHLMKGGTNELMNLGTGKGHSILEIIELIRKELGLQVKYVVKPRRAGDPDSLIADITLAEKVLQYRPEHDIISILKTAHNWHIKNG